MSRIRDVLNKSEIQGWQVSPSVWAREQLRRTEVGSKPLGNPFLSGSPSLLVSDADADAEDPEPPVEETFPEPIVTASPWPASKPSPWVRFARRIRRFFGLRVGAPAPRCSGNTRQGLPCRGPAMANGFCRLHGGARAASAGRFSLHFTR